MAATGNFPRMDNVLIVVEDLNAMKTFFLAIGLLLVGLSEQITDAGG